MCEVEGLSSCEDALPDSFHPSGRGRVGFEVPVRAAGASTPERLPAVAAPGRSLWGGEGVTAGL
ncbi:MAG: hypothetical protein ACRDZO_18725, partial [Egibacteraceae bacterium]